MTAIQIFRDNRFGEIRTTEYNGEIAFVAKDVAERLDYTWNVHLLDKIPDEWKGVKRIHSLGGEQDTAVLTEQGLYFFLARSDKPLALPFQKWIAGEVIPSIRKHGAYLTPEALEKVLLDPDTIIRIATELKNEQQLRKTAEAKIESDKPKVLFSEAVATSNTDILVGELAKILKQNGVDIGQNRLFERLRNEGYLCQTGSQRNMPTQKSMDMNLFRIKETTITHSDGHITISKTAKITGTGQVYFVNKFLGNESILLFPPRSNPLSIP